MSVEGGWDNLPDAIASKLSKWLEALRAPRHRIGRSDQRRSRSVRTSPPFRDA